MFKRMLIPAALVISTMGFGLIPKASAGWFHHDALERHQRLERNGYYGSGYGLPNGYAYPIPAMVTPTMGQLQLRLWAEPQ